METYVQCPYLMTIVDYYLMLIRTISVSEIY